MIHSYIPEQENIAFVRLVSSFHSIHLVSQFCMKTVLLLTKTRLHFDSLGFPIQKIELKDGKSQCWGTEIFISVYRIRIRI